MADFNENINKVKNTASEMGQKLMGNEKIAGTVDKINQNEYVKKVNKSKFSTIIKIGAAVVAVVVIFNVFSLIFGDKNVKKAEDYLTTELMTMLDQAGATDTSVKTKAIGKNKDASLYAFDTTIKGKVDGEKDEYTSFIIVHYDKEYQAIVYEFGYDDSNKRDKKDVTLAMLAKG